jgi:hypothetical protein
MYQRVKLIYSTQKIVWSFLLTIAVLLFTSSIAFASLYNINTDDNTWTDWSSVPLFLSDATGDVSGSCSGGTSKDDIVEVYVATGPIGSVPSHIYVRAKTAAENAISVQFHQISAYLDCPPTGQDTLDANVIYRPFGDQVALGNGITPNPDVRLYASPGTEGERPDDALDTVEWTGSFADMASFTAPGALNCTPSSTAQIKITSFKVKSTGTYDCTYDETTWRGFNIPTAVRLVSFNAARNNTLLVLSISALLLSVVIGSVGLYIASRRNI